LIADHINDQQPSDDAMARLWDALDASLDPVDAPRLPAARPDRPGTHSCLRCGYHWTPRKPSPRMCPLCRSAYWDRPPMKAYARRPENTDWPAEQARMRDSAVTRKRYRHLAKVKALAREMGLDISDPRTGKIVQRAARKARVLAEPLVAEPVAVAVAMTPTQDVIDRVYRPPFRRTVPPPPGLDDLEDKR
jgi:hypothetical protein